MSDESRRLEAVEKELLATQAAIEELSIGVWPEGWSPIFIAVFGRWPVGLDKNKEVQFEHTTKEIALQPDRVKRLFDLVHQKLGGMKTFAQRLYTEHRQYQRERNDAWDRLDKIAEMALAADASCDGSWQHQIYTLATYPKPEEPRWKP